MGIPNFLLFFDTKNWEFPFKKKKLEFKFFKVKIWAWEFPNV